MLVWNGRRRRRRWRRWITVAAFLEPVSVTSVNALAPLSHTPWPNPTAPITLMINGRGFFNTASPSDFSVSGTAITWLSTTYSVSPGDDVVAIYYYVG